MTQKLSKYKRSLECSNLSSHNGECLDCVFWNSGYSYCMAYNTGYNKAQMKLLEEKINLTEA